ncbi:GPW/gp25 family protein [Dactylosporangium vinaceum]|uniref:GPW/gp25 family protein n=1 Tax=Dactylosporangium vinaceum TaxID=53362 RepID=A0ABV5LZ95_9ACTN|nr:GPW/gp25 family protein [Dactylosporangium vinaceum]UAB92559.1 GPW/gp25 family protein [Dactylosporangium vinaceum]
MSAERTIWFAGAGSAGYGGGTGPAVTAAGALSMVEGDAAVRQALLLLLTTTPGERLMRPEYGCHLDRLLFAPNDQTTAGLAVHYVRQAILRWEPRADIVELDAAADPDIATRLNIRLRYRVRATAARNDLDLTLDLAPTPPGSRP